MVATSQHFRLKCSLAAVGFIIAVCSGGLLFAQGPELPGDANQTADPAAILDPDLLGDLQQFLDDAMSKQTEQKPVPPNEGAPGSFKPDNASKPSDPSDLSETSPPRGDSKPQDESASNGEPAMRESTPSGELSSASETDLVEAVRALDQHLSTASAGLSRGDVGAATQSAQQQAVALMKAFLDQNGQNQNQDQQSSSQSQRSDQQGNAQRQRQASQPGDENQQQGSEMRDVGTEPGSDVGSGGQGIVKASDIQALREAVWGHLPERVRGQMRASRPEDYLPRYRDAIRDYFNQLSAPVGAKR